MTGVAIAIIIILKKMNRKNGEKDMENEETEEIEENFKPNNFGQINKNNYIKTKVYEDFIIPSDRKLRVLGEISSIKIVHLSSIKMKKYIL